MKTKFLAYGLFIFSLVACSDNRPTKVFKYQLGQKVLLKTGDQAVIIDTINNSWNNSDYKVRVAFIKKKNKSVDWLGDTHTRVTDVGTFYIREFEIERAIQ